MDKKTMLCTSQTFSQNFKKRQLIVNKYLLNRLLHHQGKQTGGPSPARARGRNTSKERSIQARKATQSPITTGGD